MSPSRVGRQTTHWRHCARERSRGGNSASTGCRRMPCEAVRWIVMDIEDDYRPISCDFHDILEAAATLRKPVTVEFRDAQAGIQHRQARIADLETRADGEYMRLDTGESIRFDRIVSIDGIRLADFRP
ncbi:hypothetical protein E5843_12850 [Luteimonas yindakuii]|nr:hypothetical protein E5843_12850 [Luteimonas yindakuii]